MLPDLLPIRLRHALGCLCDKLDCYRESAVSDVRFARYPLEALTHMLGQFQGLMLPCSN